MRLRCSEEECSFPASPELAEGPVLWRVADKIFRLRASLATADRLRCSLATPHTVAIVVPASRAADGTANRHANSCVHGVPPDLGPPIGNLRHIVPWCSFFTRGMSGGALPPPTKASGSSQPSESFVKIRRKPCPVLSTEFSGPWRILATKPENQKWWSGGGSNSPAPRAAGSSAAASVRGGQAPGLRIVPSAQAPRDDALGVTGNLQTELGIAFQHHSTNTFSAFLSL